MMLESPIFALKMDNRKKKISGVPMKQGYKLGFIFFVIALLMSCVNATDRLSQTRKKVFRDKNIYGNNPDPLPPASRPCRKFVADPGYTIDYDHDSRHFYNYHDRRFDIGQHIFYRRLRSYESDSESEESNDSILPRPRRKSETRCAYMAYKYVGKHGVLPILLFFLLDTLYFSNVLSLPHTKGYLIFLFVHFFLSASGSFMRYSRYGSVKVMCFFKFVSNMLLPGNELKAKLIWMFIFFLQIIVLMIMPHWISETGENGEEHDVLRNLFNSMF